MSAGEDVFVVVFCAMVAVVATVVGVAYAHLLVWLWGVL